MVKASVIVPLHRDSKRFRRILDSVRRLPTTHNYEVLVVSDAPVPDLPPDVAWVGTSSEVDTSPAVKRDIATAGARGSLLAFLDDDAYPRADWIDAALGVFRDETIHAVGGPGLTPPESSWRERLGGAIYESRLGSGPLRYRFLPGTGRRNCDDLPAYNLWIRKAALSQIGGWGSTYYGGEDTKVCLDLSRSGFRLVYEPQVVVYHYRRDVLRPHLRQVANVGRHRGFFVRRFPESSRRPVYFLPALIVLGLLPMAFLLGLALVWKPIPVLAAGAALWLAVSTTAVERAGIAALAFPGVLLCHHVAYGISFLRGLFSRREIVT